MHKTKYHITKQRRHQLKEATHNKLHGLSHSKVEAIMDEIRNTIESVGSSFENLIPSRHFHTIDHKAQDLQTQADISVFEDRCEILQLTIDMLFAAGFPDFFSKSQALQQRCEQLKKMFNVLLNVKLTGLFNSGNFFHPGKATLLTIIINKIKFLRQLQTQLALCQLRVEELSPQTKEERLVGMLNSVNTEIRLVGDSVSVTDTVERDDNTFNEVQDYLRVVSRCLQRDKDLTDEQKNRIGHGLNNAICASTGYSYLSKNEFYSLQLLLLSEGFDEDTRQTIEKSLCEKIENDNLPRDKKIEYFTVFFEMVDLFCEDNDKKEHAIQVILNQCTRANLKTVSKAQEKLDALKGSDKYQLQKGGRTNEKSEGYSKNFHASLTIQRLCGELLLNIKKELYASKGDEMRQRRLLWETHMRTLTAMKVYIQGTVLATAYWKIKIQLVAEKILDQISPSYYYCGQMCDQQAIFLKAMIESRVKSESVWEMIYQMLDSKYLTLHGGEINAWYDNNIFQVASNKLQESECENEPTDLFQETSMEIGSVIFSEDDALGVLWDEEGALSRKEKYVLLMLLLAETKKNLCSSETKLCIQESLPTRMQEEGDHERLQTCVDLLDMMDRQSSDDLSKCEVISLVNRLSKLLQQMRASFGEQIEQGKQSKFELQSHEKQTLLAICVLEKVATEEQNAIAKNEVSIKKKSTDDGLGSIDMVSSDVIGHKDGDKAPNLSEMVSTQSVLKHTCTTQDEQTSTVNQGSADASQLSYATAQKECIEPLPTQDGKNHDAGDHRSEPAELVANDKDLSANRDEREVSHMATAMFLNDGEKHLFEDQFLCIQALLEMTLEFELYRQDTSERGEHKDAEVRAEVYVKQIERIDHLQTQMDRWPQQSVELKRVCTKMKTKIMAHLFHAKVPSVVERLGAPVNLIKDLRGTFMTMEKIRQQKDRFLRCLWIDPAFDQSRLESMLQVIANAITSLSQETPRVNVFESMMQQFWCEKDIDSMEDSSIHVGFGASIRDQEVVEKVSNITDVLLVEPEERTDWDSMYDAVYKGCVDEIQNPVLKKIAETLIIREEKRQEEVLDPEPQQYIHGDEKLDNQESSDEEARVSTDEHKHTDEVKTQVEQAEGKDKPLMDAEDESTTADGVVTADDVQAEKGHIDDGNNDAVATSYVKIEDKTVVDVGEAETQVEEYEVDNKPLMDADGVERREESKSEDNVVATSEAEAKKKTMLVDSEASKSGNANRECSSQVHVVVRDPIQIMSRSEGTGTLMKENATKRNTSPVQSPVVSGDKESKNPTHLSLKHPDELTKSLWQEKWPSHIDPKMVKVTEGSESSDSGTYRSHGSEWWTESTTEAKPQERMKPSNLRFFTDKPEIKEKRQDETEREMTDWSEVVLTESEISQVTRTESSQEDTISFLGQSPRSV